MNCALARAQPMHWLVAAQDSRLAGEERRLCELPSGPADALLLQVSATRFCLGCHCTTDVLPVKFKHASRLRLAADDDIAVQDPERHLLLPRAGVWRVWWLWWVYCYDSCVLPELLLVASCNNVSLECVKNTGVSVAKLACCRVQELCPETASPQLLDSIRSCL